VIDADTTARRIADELLPDVAGSVR
jgi:hypothetical protein